ncbi:hypothetical protein [Shewanella sp. LZH-2]|uniref:hypothetical protein n=1 Tax=Shewanella sp. LZH-2 TaxID=2806008 RepID=UPI00193D4AD5|nr:hypothetical protein [Shewanella sp. LZH-2]QRK80157.1 hypothetical protein JM642_03320 [Shewanella sp. LZH-2]
MTPYAKRLLKYAIANCPARPVRKGKSKAELLADREQWAVNYLNGALGHGWPQRRSQPKAIRVLVSESATTTDEDDE